ncbi:MAG: electron transfer flavoprotein subunit alpha/FixB family protein, partial [Gammaproteobacteria bacterium]
MTILVIAEHDNSQLKPSTLNTVAAAARLEGDVELLVAGHGCSRAADKAAKVPGIGRVLVADHPQYEHALAEELSLLVTGLAEGYTHV